MIEKYIKEKYPETNERSIVYGNELTRVCNTFVNSGLADNKFIEELTSGDDSKFWSCLSEAFVVDKLKNKHFPKRPISVGVGPDFLIRHDNLNIWIEVICPKPIDIDPEWLNASGNTCHFPHEKLLLRWTSAIKEKAEKLIGNKQKQIKGYLEKQIVNPEDAYVIVVNGCQLRNGPFESLNGISHFPLAAEAVFPIGPMQITLEKETGKVVHQDHKHKPFIINKNRAKVPTISFIDLHFQNISAIWAIDITGLSIIGNTDPMSVIHNPLAKCKIPVGILPSDSEYVATKINESEYILENIKSQETVNG